MGRSFDVSKHFTGGNPVIYVDTVADLQSLDTSGLVEGQAASVQGSEFRWDGSEWLPVGAVSIKAFGATGDGATDDSGAVADAMVLASSKGWHLTGNGNTYACASTINEILNDGLLLSDASFLYTGDPDQHAFIRFRTQRNCYIERCHFDADEKASKVLDIKANSSNASIVFRDSSFKNGLQTNEATSTACGVEVRPDDTENYYKKLTVDNCVFENITSVRDNPEGVSLVAMGRGVGASDCESVVITNSTFKDIGPHWDGDGVAVWANRDVPERRENFKLQVSDCVFIDCHKRCIKAQVGQAVVSDLICQRTQPFEFYAGQAEVNLLDGGRISNIYCYYATGSAPRHIFAISSSQKINNTAPSYSVTGITVDFENPDDVIESIGRFTLGHQGKVENAIMSEVSVGCYVHNLLSIRAVNQETSDDGVFENVVLDNVYVRGFDLTQDDAALVVVTRGSVSYSQPNVSFYNCRAADGTAPNVFYEDPGPGTTTFIRPNLRERYSTPARDAASRVIRDIATPSRTYRYALSENSSEVIEFDMPDRASGSCKVSVFYTSTRDERGAKLFTEGVVQVGGDRSFYLETVAGNKTNARSGSISIEENTAFRRFSVEKGSGGTSNFGELIIIVQDIGYISEVFD